MSFEAYTWALNLAPVPMDPGGARKGPQPSSACAFVLAGLANHANPDGTDSFPGVPTLMRYTRLSERTVRTCLDRLEEAGVIKPGDPDVVAAKIKRGDRRPQGWDLCMDRMRDDLTDAEMEDIARQNAWLRPWIELHKTGRGATDAPRERGATDAPREPERGATTAERGATTAERGATAAPKQSFDPSGDPSGSSTPSAADAAASDEPPDGGLFAASQAAPPAPPPQPTFEDFYAKYPLKRARAKAEDAWRKVVKAKTPLTDVTAGLDQYLAWLGRNPHKREFIPHPATWLNQGRWMDEYDGDAPRPRDEVAERQAMYRSWAEQAEQIDAAFGQRQAAAGGAW